jgi:plasmid stabilization system protein ParE
MRIRYAARARREANRINAWWIENRPSAPTLFMEELGHALELISAHPGLGTPYTSAYGTVQRVLLPRTRYHVYYAQESGQAVVVSIWGAQRRRGPKL